MTGRARIVRGVVEDSHGTVVGEARLWCAPQSVADGGAWRGWLLLADLGVPNLARDRYRLRAFDGWESAFEPTGGRASRIIETELLPVVGLDPAPWAEDDGESPPPYHALFGDAPPRVADDRSRWSVAGLDRAPRIGLLPARPDDAVASAPARAANPSASASGDAEPYRVARLPGPGVAPSAADNGAEREGAQSGTALRRDRRHPGQESLVSDQTGESSARGERVPLQPPSDEETDIERRER